MQIFSSARLEMNTRGYNSHSYRPPMSSSLSSLTLPAFDRLSDSCFFWFLISPPPLLPLLLYSLSFFFLTAAQQRRRSCSIVYVILSWMLLFTRLHSSSIKLTCKYICAIVCVKHLDCSHSLTNHKDLTVSMFIVAFAHCHCVCV